MTDRDRMIVVVAVCVAAMVGAWMFAIQPKRNQASSLGSQVSQEQTALNSARAQVMAGQAAKNRFSTNYTSLAQLGKAVPADDDVPSLIYQIQHAAASAGVDFRVLQLQSSGGTPAPAASSSGASATQASASTLPPGAAIGSAGFPTLPFSFTFQGNFFRLAYFFDLLEHFVVSTSNHLVVNGRLMTLNSINLGPAAQGFPEIKATISATTFVIPATQGLTAGATPFGPPTGTAGPATPTQSGSPATPTAAVSVR